MAEFDFEKIIQQIRDLEKERAEILTQSLSPEGAWIHHYTKKKVYPSGFVGWYQYAKWQANEPIFDRKPKQHKKRMREREAGVNQNLVKDQHIGRMWSSTGLGCEPEVIEAFEVWERRKRLEAIDKTLSVISKMLSVVSESLELELPPPPEAPSDINQDHL
ncbi:MAG: hypothetical protein AAFV46_04835 [Cyanobacteria bacterium J06635_11]